MAGTLSIGNYITIKLIDHTVVRGTILLISDTQLKLVEKSVTFDINISDIESAHSVYENAKTYVVFLYIAVIVLYVFFIIVIYLINFSVFSGIPFAIAIVFYLFSIFYIGDVNFSSNEDIIAIGYRGGIFALYFLIIYALYDKVESHYLGNKLAFKTITYVALGLSLFTAIDLAMTDNCAAFSLYARYVLHSTSMLMVLTLLIEFASKYKYK
jgi:hypothetical protein